MRTFRDPQDGLGWEKKPQCATDLNNFLQEIKTTPLLSFFGIMAWASLVRASDAVPISIIPRNAVGGVVASSGQKLRALENLTF